MPCPPLAASCCACAETPLMPAVQMNGTEFESEKEARCARPMATDRSGGAARQYTAPVVHVLVPIGNRPFQDASLLVGLNRLIGVPGRDVAASGLPDDRRHGRLQGLALIEKPGAAARAGPAGSAWPDAWLREASTRRPSGVRGGTLCGNGLATMVQAVMTPLSAPAAGVSPFSGSGCPAVRRSARRSGRHPCAGCRKRTTGSARSRPSRPDECG